MSKEHEPADPRAWATMSAAEAGTPTDDPDVLRLRRMMHLLDAFAVGRRTVCPTRVDLVAYQAGELSHDTVEGVQAHVAVCPACWSDLADLSALASPPLLEVVVELAHDALRLVRHTFGSAATPLAAPVRGEPVGAIELAAEQEALRLHLSVDTAADDRADLRVRLNGTADAGLGEHWRISLYRGDHLLESRQIPRQEPAGEVDFARVGHGRYTVVVTAAGAEVGRLEIDLQPAHD